MVVLPVSLWVGVLDQVLLHPVGRLRRGDHEGRLDPREGLADGLTVGEGGHDRCRTRQIRCPVGVADEEAKGDPLRREAVGHAATDATGRPGEGDGSRGHGQRRSDRA